MESYNIRVVQDLQDLAFVSDKLQFCISQCFVIDDLDCIFFVSKAFKMSPEYCRELSCSYLLDEVVDLFDLRSGLIACLLLQVG